MDNLPVTIIACGGVNDSDQNSINLIDAADSLFFERNPKSINNFFNLYESHLHDCPVIDEIYEEVLNSLHEKLNNYHHLDKPKIYWRIIIGPWLYPIVALLYDRWVLVKRALKYNVKKIYISSENLVSVIPDNLSNFNPYSNFFNEIIFREILIYLHAESFSLIEVETSTEPCRKKVITKKKNSLFLLLSKLIGFFPRKYFLYGTKFTIKDEILLNLNLKQIPFIYSTPKYDISNIPILDRSSLNFKSDKKDSFINFLGSFIGSIIPKGYIEGFSTLKNIVLQQNWPNKPNIIFTSISYNSDEIFKIWMAEKKIHGTKVIIGQHGSTFGMAKCMPTENHFFKIANFFYTWGWGDRMLNQIPGYAFPLKNIKKITPLKTGFILILITSFGFHSYKNISMPRGFVEVNQYSNMVLSLVGSFTKILQNNISVRYREELELRTGQSISSNIISKFPSVKLESSHSKMANSLRKSRLSILTYNSTTLIENILIDFPTLIIFDKDLNKLNEKAHAIFSKLEIVGIYHGNIDSLISHFINIQNDIDSWWNSPKTIEVKSEFLDFFAKSPNCSIPHIFNLITSDDL